MTKDDKRPLITVVTVTYDCASKVEKTICSVLSQTYPNIEYIIIDGGSKDGTVDIIKKYSKNLSYFVSEQDKGIFDAMNKALEIATGTWINFMNAGDVFSDKNIVYEIFSDIKPDYSVIWGRVDGICNDGHIIKKKCPIPFYEQLGFVKRMGMNHQGVFVNIEQFKDLRFDLSFHIASDYDMLQKIYDKGGRFIYFDSTVAIVEIEDGLSANNRDIQRLEEAIISGVNIKSTKFILWNTYWRFRNFVATIIK